MSTITLAERLCEIQKELGMNTNSFAKKCGMAAAQMTRYLNGEYKNPTLSSLKSIADSLGYSISYLIGENTTYSDTGDFVRVFRWTVDQRGDRAKTSSNAMIHKETIKRLGVTDEDLLDIIVMPNNSMSPIINKDDDLLCYALDESDPDIVNGSLYLFVCYGYVYVGYIERNFDGTLSIWTEQNKEKQSMTPDKIVIKAKVLMRSGSLM